MRLKIKEIQGRKQQMSQILFLETYKSVCRHFFCLITLILCYKVASNWELKFETRDFRDNLKIIPAACYNLYT